MTTHYRTGKGSHRHADIHCANARRSVLTGYPVKIPADEVGEWPACEFCCTAEEVAKSLKAQPVKCDNGGVKNPRRMYSTCVDCGKEGAVNRNTGTLRAHAPLN